MKDIMECRMSGYFTIYRNGELVLQRVNMRNMVFVEQNAEYTNADAFILR